MPEVARHPEIIHGLRNLIQNAVDFSRQKVRIEARWTPERITVTVTDDGPGYPPHLLSRIGEPWLRDRRSPVPEGRTTYEGMGLGLFIAKTLLERTGARVAFDNAQDGGGRVTGARARASWTRSDIEADPSRPLGQNRPLAREAGQAS